jgi:hypothetical protein
MPFDPYGRPLYDGQWVCDICGGITNTSYAYANQGRCKACTPDPKFVARKRVTWGVFNNSNQLVKEFDYPQRAEAEAHAAKLMAETKSTHFVQPVKK